MKNGYGKNKRLPEKFEAGMISTLDGRTDLAKRLSYSFNKVANDLGGVEGLPHVRVALIERFAWLEEFLRAIELKIGEDPVKQADLMGKWVQGTNSLNGLAKMLGVEQPSRTKAAPDLYDTILYGPEQDAPENTRSKAENTSEDDWWAEEPKPEPKPQKRKGKP